MTKLRNMIGCAFVATSLLTGFAINTAHADDSGKYPPAKPGALGCEPLKAVGRVADAAREFGAAEWRRGQRHKFICSSL